MRPPSGMNQQPGASRPATVSVPGLPSPLDLPILLHVDDTRSTPSAVVAGSLNVVAASTRSRVSAGRAPAPGKRARRPRTRPCSVRDAGSAPVRGKPDRRLTDQRRRSSGAGSARAPGTRARRPSRTRSRRRPPPPTAANEASAAPAPLSIADSQPTRGMQAIVPADVGAIANRPATTSAASIAPSTEAPPGVRGFPARVR